MNRSIRLVDGQARDRYLLLLRASTVGGYASSLAEAKDQRYLVFITGPRRTADIELTVTLGVHGPKNLYVWMLIE